MSLEVPPESCLSSSRSRKSAMLAVPEFCQAATNGEGYRPNHWCEISLRETFGQSSRLDEARLSPYRLRKKSLGTTSPSRIS